MLIGLLIVFSIVGCVGVCRAEGAVPSPKWDRSSTMSDGRLPAGRVSVTPTAIDAIDDGKPIRRNVGQSPGRKLSRSSSSRSASKAGTTSQLAKMPVDEVAAWLHHHGHSDAAERFKSNDVTGEMLEGLTDAELKEMGVTSLGERKKLLLLIENAVGPTKSYSADHKGSRKPGHSPSRPAESSGGGRVQPHLSNPADTGKMMGATAINLFFAVIGLSQQSTVIDPATLVVSLLVGLVFWSLSCDNLGALAMGIRYERVDGTGKAGIGSMAVSCILQQLFYGFSIGICFIVDVCMVLSSAKRQGITGRMFGIYPVEKSRSAFNGRVNIQTAETVDLS